MSRGRHEPRTFHRTIASMPSSSCSKPAYAVGDVRIRLQRFDAAGPGYAGLLKDVTELLVPDLQCRGCRTRFPERHCGKVCTSTKSCCSWPRATPARTAAATRSVRSADESHWVPT